MWYRCCCRAALHVSGTRGFRGRVRVGCCGLGNKLPSNYSDCNITMSSALHALIEPESLTSAEPKGRAAAAADFWKKE